MPVEAPPAPPAAAPPPSRPATPAPTPAPSTRAPAARETVAPAPPKPTSAIGRTFEKIAQKAQAPDPRPVPNAPKITPSQEAAQETPELNAEATEAEPGTETPASTETSPETKPGAEKGASEKGADGAKPSGTKEKVNPWRLVDDYKAKNKALNERIAEMEKQPFSPEERKKIEERATKAEQRAKELEDEIIFHDFSKSSQFKEQYDKPYETAWSRAMGDLKELTVEASDGSVRAFSANDMLQLVNLPLPKARELAVSLFGEFANDVMTHRKEIRNLLETRTSALEEAKQNGAAKLRERIEAEQRTKAETQKFIGETWERVNQEALKDEHFGEFFRPVEGDDELNAKLEKGYKQVDEAFASNPEDPKLDAKQREAIVRRHSKIRNAAAAFDAVVMRYKRLLEKTTALEARLKEYEGSEPKTVGREEAPAAPAASGSAWDRIGNALRAKAR